ncbi:hypothetical protein AAG906_034398 [Vitis piasezkii]
MNKFSELQKYGTETTWGEKESDQDRGLTRDVEQSESSALAPARAERRCYYFVFRLDCPFSSFHFSHPTRRSYIHFPRISEDMGLWTLLEGCLLIANALAILNEDRFLAPRGWSFSEFSGGRTKSFKGQLIGLIYATQYLRVPLILLNSICIIIKLVSG